MKLSTLLLAGLLLFTGPLALRAETLNLAGDVFAADGTVILDGEAATDIFAAGNAITVRQLANGNVHAAGRTIELLGAIAGDAYAAGMTITLNGATAGRVYAFGYEIKLLADNQIGGGARLAGRTVAVEGDIKGTLMAGGEAVALAGTIEGDVFVSADTLTLSPDARITGDLHYEAENPIDVPEGVVSGSVVYDGPPEGAGSGGDVVSGFLEGDALTMLAGGTGSFLVFCQLVAGVVIFVGFPGLSGRIRQAVEGQTGANFLWGIVALGCLIGAVLVTAMTLIGIPIALLLVLAIPLFLVAAFAVGAVGWILLAAKAAKWDVPFTGWARLLLALAAVVPIYLLGALPMIGWAISLATTLFGLGALLTALRTKGQPAPAV